MAGSNLLIHLDTIDQNDLIYAERDMNFAQKVGLCFLLYGDDHSDATYILQKLLVMARSDLSQSDLLIKFAKSRPETWRRHLVEALCIIGARKVLRRLGFCWQELRMHYLPHIAGITLHVHPLLKSLYRMCEELSLAQSGRLFLDVGEKVASQQAGDPLRFYDPAYLEIFLLDWLTKRSIKLGDINAAGSNVDLLVEHLKFNDLHAQAKLITDTIISNAPEPDAAGTAAMAIKQEIESDNQQSKAPAIKRIGALKLTRENAGIALIINQQEFHRNVSKDIKKLLSPDPLHRRDGTDVDKERLIEVFSSMGYNVEAYDNVDHLGIIERIRSACERSLLRDSLVVFILSHGFEEAVYGANSIALKISDIENMLCSYGTLSNKPKLLIIQACQEKPAQKKEQNEPFNLDVTTRSPGQHINMLRAMSTVNGYAALRHTQKGSWFIGSLCDAIDSHSSSEHIADILTIVTNEVSKKRGSNDESMVPNVKSTFRQHVYFPPRQ
ncbi:caspase-8 isoform X1 [Drosophila sechellia]|uniref:Caspase-8 n=3 Tax=melanogaster subgroup TaxID=32351 RepID=B4I943_DROSE|nr:caspase-8 isoform X1 [Drosophila sechellia]EDW43724.1 GM19030 [Drosophila sechellia]